MSLALNDDTIDRTPTFTNRLSLWLIKAIVILASCLLFVAAVVFTMSALVIGAVLLLILSPVIILGMER